MLNLLNDWATSNPDAAYLAGFLVIVLTFYGLSPYQSALNVATSKDIRFKSMDIGAQVKKPHRLAYAAGAVATFAFIHFALNAPLLALVLGAVPLAVLAVTDYIQLSRDNDPSA